MPHTDLKLDLALQAVKRYVEAMYQADRWSREERRKIKRERSLSAVEGKFITTTALAEKVAAYRQLWRDEGDYWMPSSLGWPSEFDPSQIEDWRVAEGEGGSVLVSFRSSPLGSSQKNVFTVAFFDEEPKIVGYEYEL